MTRRAHDCIRIPIDSSRMTSSAKVYQLDHVLTATESPLPDLFPIRQALRFSWIQRPCGALARST